MGSTLKYAKKLQIYKMSNIYCNIKCAKYDKFYIFTRPFGSKFKYVEMFAKFSKTKFLSKEN